MNYLSRTNLRQSRHHLRPFLPGLSPGIEDPYEGGIRNRNCVDSRRGRDFSVLHTTSEWKLALAQSTKRFPLPMIVDYRHHRHHYPHLPLRSRFVDTEQVRFRRHDRSSAFAKPRPKTKKQRQTYNRRMKKENEEKAKHNPPGSKAGPRRQWAKDRWQQLLDHGKQNDESTALLDPNAMEQYTLEDALLEEIVGNTAHLTSQPTPVPVYLGHRHKDFYNKVADQMDAYREAINAAASDGPQASSSSSSSSPSTVTSVGLPSDKDISNVVRAYRDRHGTRQKPIGIVMILQHLLQDLGVPTVAFGEYTYTALLTCCRTPPEAGRIFKLMTENNHPISPYSWSILVDVHSKIGDFEGCSKVLQEMTSHGGHAPTQAAYTSLLAACYKVCNDGRVPHAIRAEAGTVGWNHWQQMRIVGIEPDAMAYGAIIRLCAARGQPERAIGLLEDMQRFDVKPTTLCFSGALKAVAKSHEIAIRFENGWSPKQLKRESTAAHHGNMARRIVIMAEAAEVEQDEGFVSALMLCAAAAGDSATAKAIFLAAEVRRMDHLRTIGSNEPFQINSDGRYENVAGLLEESTGSEGSSLVATNPTDNLPSNAARRNSHEHMVESYGEREYGKDTRTLSALMHASAQAMNRNGIGTIWAGRENLGFLCENSLRLITTRWEPSYRDTSIPGVSSTKVGIGALRRMDENDRDDDPKPGKRKKFRGLYIDDDAAMTVDDLDDEQLFISKGAKNVDPDDDIFSSDEAEFERKFPDPLARSFSSPVDDREKLIEELQANAELSESDLFDTFLSELKLEAARNGEEFDLSESETRELFEYVRDEFSNLIDGDSGVSETGEVFLAQTSASTNFDAAETYEEFLSPLKNKAEKAGEDINLSEEQIQEVLQLFRDDMQEGDRAKIHSLSVATSEELSDIFSAQASPLTQFEAAETYDEFPSPLKKEPEKVGEDFDVSDAQVQELLQLFQDDMEDGDKAKINALFVADELFNEGSSNFDGRNSTDDPTTSNAMFINEDGMKDPSEPFESNALLNLEKAVSDLALASSVDVTSKVSNQLSKIEELQAALPGMPLGRLKKIVNAFEERLGYPSILSLIPILRETMPNYVTSGWLKRTNRQNAEFVLAKASEDGLVDHSLLNAMLEVMTNAGSIDGALEFHATEFHKHKLSPSSYSDRMVLQMLVTNQRLSRALTFKETLETEGRYLDIPSYGTLVQHYSRHKQLGSALLLLKECIDRHGAAPSEAYLSMLRTLSKQQHQTDIGLNAMIGDDPIAWLKHGERHLKRESSKKGRRNVNRASNRILA